MNSDKQANILKANYTHELINRLRNSDIDWNKYISDYPDIRDSGMDPVHHFLEYGFDEGREIKKKDGQIFPSEQPKVSIIVPNYNNCVFLEKSINSLLNQTLKEIEIIVIDDCSTDHSLEILYEMSKLDTRIKIIEFKSNKNRHMARKEGMRVASGKYMMFLDPDDYFDIHACEIAYLAAQSGYDIVYFNIACIYPNHTISVVNDYNNARAGEYNIDEMFHSYFTERKLRFSLNNKIFSSHICKQSLESIEDGVFPFAEDCYMVTVISKNAKKFLKINDVLYYYRVNYRSEIMGNPERILNQFSQFWTLFPAFEIYSCENGFMRYYKDFKKIMYKYNIINFYNCNHPEFTQAYLDSAYKYYGLNEFLKSSAEIDTNMFFKIVTSLAKYNINDTKDKLHVKNYSCIYEQSHPKVIGLFTPDLQDYDICSFISYFKTYIPADRYQLKIFSEFNQHNLANSFESVTFLEDSSSNVGAIPRHLSRFASILQEDKVDILLHAGVHYYPLLWVIQAARNLGIPVFGLQTKDFNLEMRGKQRQFLSPIKYYPHFYQAKVLRGLHILICGTKESEVYYRALGINARFINPGINNREYRPEHSGKRRKWILVNNATGQLINHAFTALPVLGEVMKKIPEAKMVINGVFGDPSREKLFWEAAHKTGVSKSVCVLPATFDMRALATDCKVMFSPCCVGGWLAMESAAFEAGMHCVIYDVPTGLREYAPNITVVPQNDHRLAAKALTEILAGNPKYEGDHAEFTSPRSRSCFFAELQREFEKSSKYAATPRSPKDYQDVLRLIERNVHRGFPAGWIA